MTDITQSTDNQIGAIDKWNAFYREDKIVELVCYGKPTDFKIDFQLYASMISSLVFCKFLRLLKTSGLIYKKPSIG